MGRWGRNEGNTKALLSLRADSGELAGSALFLLLLRMFSRETGLAMGEEISETLATGEGQSGARVSLF